MKVLSGASAYEQLIANTRARTVRIPPKSDRRAFRDGGIFPPLKPKFQVGPGETVFTIGSCFARNVEAVLERHGLDVPVAGFTLPPGELPYPAPHILNEYNAGTIIQRIESACGLFSHDGDKGIEEVADGFVDLFLHIHAKPVARERLLARRREVHALYGRLAGADLAVITLGLVESWFDTEHRCYLNRAPGRAWVRQHPGRFEFHRMDVGDVADRMSRAVDMALGLGVGKVLLTVSPVPIEATFMAESAVVANSYSKAVLRVCAEALSAGNDRVDYFPSYEIVSSFGTRAFRDDNVHVEDAVVAQVTEYMVETYSGAAERRSDVDLHGRVMRKLAARDHRGAREDVLDLCRSHPESWVTQDALAQLFVETGSLDAALESITRAIAIAGPMEELRRRRTAIEHLVAERQAGPVPPATEREAVPPRAEPARSRAAADRGAEARCAGGEALSVVVQGPCVRRHHDQPGPSLDDALASVRARFPEAEVIVSTWRGSDVDGLDADEVVLSADPGPLDHPRQGPSNFNRMLTATAAGLRAARRPFCIKTRNDVLFGSDALIRKPLSPAADRLSIGHRIWVASVGTARIDAYLRPFHPCDMVQFGTADDLRRLWGGPALTWGDVFLPDLGMTIPRLCPEQALFTGYLRSNGIDATLDATIDGRPEVVATSVQTMLGAFDVFDEEDEGVVFSPRIAAGKHPHLRDSAQSFRALRAMWDADPAAAAARLQAAFQDRLRLLLSGRLRITEDPAVVLPAQAGLPAQAAA